MWAITERSCLVVIGDEEEGGCRKKQLQYVCHSLHNDACVCFVYSIGFAEGLSPACLVSQPSLEVGVLGKS